ncbi:putative [Sonchus yellow net nucleorhabdovirus]|uniref:Phosphoprotein n=1 Tax=Sonchus yellow net virus TaxID=11307 RepID=PHOSP_SYNV|nr:putative [Sonchus yellow net nucleorhabdovirus]P21299.1 RecName: Full=Phosphoprotein; Short=Protein P; AltName: Full=Protein M1 [Sonchus yellow net nucleorhabdovirus]AAA47897.1 M1 protein [Sonchus yellow net nucleorhabdovirus]AAA50383.1 putative [Sonchus yellow net nucleorhabdovirus]
MAGIYAVSIKGHASAIFNRQEKEISTGRVWEVMKKIMSLKPTRVIMSYSLLRSALDKSRQLTQEEYNIMQLILDGCVKTLEPVAASGICIDVNLGKCTKHTIPFGITNNDVGHVSVVMTLPFLEEGCYNIGACFDGRLSKSRSDASHYAVDVSLEIYLKSLSRDEAEEQISKGTSVYPFKINHPTYFEDETDTSDGESLSGRASSDDGPEDGGHGHGDKNNEKNSGKVVRKRKSRKEIDVGRFKMVKDNIINTRSGLLKSMRGTGHRKHRTQEITEGYNYGDKDAE